MLRWIAHQHRHHSDTPTTTRFLLVWSDTLMMQYWICSSSSSPQKYRVMVDRRRYPLAATREDSTGVACGWWCTVLYVARLVGSVVGKGLAILGGGLQFYTSIWECLHLDFVEVVTERRVIWLGCQNASQSLCRQEEILRLYLSIACLSRSACMHIYICIALS